MSNVRPAPLAFTPQVVRTALGVGWARGIVLLDVVGRVNERDRPAPPPSNLETRD